MSTFVFGDIQGCFQELQDLLDKINFDEANDKLWFTGDLVNRGPDSLATVRLAKKYNAISVLGNHECHLLAIAAGTIQARSKDTLDTLLSADDKNELIEWVRQLPLIHFDEDSGYIMLHAGLHPEWDIPKARELANEAALVLRSNKSHDFLTNMYGNQPDQWDEELTGWDRLRFIINVFTRMRYCDVNGRMNFKDNGPPGTQSKNFHPWFSLENRRSRSTKIIFGHWASLHQGNPGDFQNYNVYPLDTGCVWGRNLTAMRLEDESFISVPSRQK